MILRSLWKNRQRNVYVCALSCFYCGHPKRGQGEACTPEVEATPRLYQLVSRRAARVARESSIASEQKEHWHCYRQEQAEPNNTQQLRNLSRAATLSECKDIWWEADKSTGHRKGKEWILSGSDNAETACSVQTGRKGHIREMVGQEKSPRLGAKGTRFSLQLC